MCAAVSLCDEFEVHVALASYSNNSLEPTTVEHYAFVRLHAEIPTGALFS